MSAGKDVAVNPFGSSRVAGVAASAVADAAAAREVAEIQGAMLIARRFPRDQKTAMDRILQACTRKTLAEEATFQYARGGTDIAAPSIRLAEAIAQNWGNLECGVKEMSRVGNYSEVMAYAVDLETGFRDSKVFQVKHWRDTKQGGYAITDERDIYELIANMAARRKRACILTVIPGDVVDSAMNQIEVTMKADIVIDQSTVDGVLESLARFGVNKEMIEKRIQRRLSVETLSPALYLNLKRIFQSMKDGMSGPDEWFDMGVKADAADGIDESTVAGRAAAAAKRAAAASEAKAKEEAERKAKEEADRKAKDEADAKAKTEAEERARKEAEAKGGAKKDDKKKDKKKDEAKDPLASVVPGTPGTPELKTAILARFETCKDSDELSTAAELGNIIKWEDADRKEITAAYLARLEKLG